jgi:phospholipid/cholesterol/gamma-HCH transport system permease protein
MPDRVRDTAHAFGAWADFSWRMMRGVFSPSLVRYYSEVVRQAGILISGSLLVVMGLVFALGGVVGIEGAYGARLVGAPAAAGAFTAIGNLRELTPYAFGYMFAAKVSTGYVAEIGTMRISDEIDALDVMGIPSLLWLGSTRLLASWIVLPFLFAFGVVCAYVASFLTVVFEIGQVSPGGYLELFWKFQSVGDYLGSIVKAMSMGTFVVLVGVYYGYTVRGGPVDVGRATARAMIVNLMGIHVIGILGSQFFWGGNATKLPIGG